MTTRRGISSIVGAVFAIIALTTTVAYVSYSMNILDQYNLAVVGKNQQTLDLGKEKFQVSSATIVNNKFNITGTNTGNLPISFTKIWVQNTTGTDWVRSYVPANNFVGSGATFKNIGQNIPLYAKSTQSYHIKLVTSRGNTQEFNVNSVGSAPLNIQLYALPPSVSSGFTTKIVMVVINNSTGTLVNVAPTASVNPPPPGSPTCVLDSASAPLKYYTLPVGGTAVFTWSLTAAGSANQVCTVTAQLQNGYPNQSVQTTVTITQVTLASTTYAQNAGVITNDYTGFRWAQTTQWRTGWQFNSGNTAFSLLLTNNNQTTGGYKFWISQYSQIFFQQAGGNANPKSFYVVKSVTLGSPSASVTAYTPEFYQSVDNVGGTGTVYFGSQAKGSDSQGGSIQSLSSGTYTGFIVMYGKFAINQNDAGTEYAQTIPFIAVIVN